MTKVQDGFMVFFLVCFVMLFTALGYWRFFPEDPVIYGEIKILTPVVKAGGELRLSIEMTKKTVFPSQIAKTLVSCDSARIYPLPIETGAMPPGHYNAIYEVKIPSTVDPGEYKLRSTAVFFVNPITQVIRSYESDCFWVVP
jgi:hypothetical protein